jgi:hypothetical protein
MIEVRLRGDVVIESRLFQQAPGAEHLAGLKEQVPVAGRPVVFQYDEAGQARLRNDLRPDRAAC